MEVGHCAIHSLANTVQALLGPGTYEGDRRGNRLDEAETRSGQDGARMNECIGRGKDRWERVVSTVLYIYGSGGGQSV